MQILNQIYADQGPSDAQRMKSAMVVIDDDDRETSLDEKLNAWDELELLVESYVSLLLHIGPFPLD